MTVSGWKTSKNGQIRESQLGDAQDREAQDRNGVVSYRLSRQQTLKALEQGRKLSSEVCDAQAELRRVAHHHGVAIEEDCPVCEGEDLVQVTFAFGAGLPRGGRCVSDSAQLEGLRSRGRATTCYRVEVCRHCWWNHLQESFILRSLDSADQPR